MKKARDVMGKEIFVGDKVAIVHLCGSLAKLVRGTVQEVKTLKADGKPRLKPEVVVRTGRYGIMTCKEVRQRFTSTPTAYNQSDVFTKQGNQYELPNMQQRPDCPSGRQDQ